MLVMLDYFPEMSHQFMYNLVMVERNCFLAIIYSSIFPPKRSNPNRQISPLELPCGVQVIPSWLNSYPFVKLK